MNLEELRNNGVTLNKNAYPTDATPRKFAIIGEVFDEDAAIEKMDYYAKVWESMMDAWRKQNERT